eukprot:2615470-Prorocentrum_lima.AAC.1
MPGTASLRCNSNMGAEGELAMKTKSSMYSMCGLKEQDAVWWLEGKKGEKRDTWCVDGARQGDCSLITSRRKE